MALLQKAYLGATPLFRNEDWFEDDAPKIIDAPSTVTVTANSSAHTKGAWTEIISSTTADASFVVCVVGGIGVGSTNSATLIDFATGASGSETAIVSDIAVGGAFVFASGNSTRGTPGIVFGFPLKIPSGTRISARIQSVITGGKTALVDVFTIDAGDYATAPTSVDAIGSDTATSQGVSFAGASGSWTEAIASTSQAYRGVAFVLSCHTTSAVALFDKFSVGVGASGSEVAFGDSQYEIAPVEYVGIRQPFTYLFGRSIPAGSRLAVRHALPSNPDRYGFTLIGIP